MEKGSIPTYEFDRHRVIVGECKNRAKDSDEHMFVFELFVIDKNESVMHIQRKKCILHLYIKGNQMSYENHRFVPSDGISLLDLTMDTEELNQFVRCLLEEPICSYPIPSEAILLPTTAFQKVIHQRRLPSLFT